MIPQLGLISMVAWACWVALISLFGYPSVTRRLLGGIEMVYFRITRSLFVILI